MTPLPRWVLLASLLAVVAAHPVEHACVPLCRARTTSPEITGVCKHQQKLVLQSGGGRFPIQRLFRLCLFPCHGAGSSESLIYDDTKTCRTFRESLIQRQGCSCDDLNDERTRNLEGDRWRVDEIEKDRLKEADGSNMLRKADEEQVVAAVDVEDRQGLEIKDLSEGTMKVIEIEVDTLSKADSQDSVVVNLNSGSLMEGSDYTEEASVDWELWCMAQCNNGKGGSACHCDIIP